IGGIANGEIRNATARVAIPSAGTHIAAGTDVEYLVVRGGVCVTGYACSCTLASCGGRRVDLPGLAECERYASRLRLQVDRINIRILQPIAETIAIISCRVAVATGESHPRWNCQKDQKNERQIPPHESSPPRLIEPRNGLSKCVKK